MQSITPPFHKRHIARHFNQAAYSYDAAAQTQRNIGLALIHQLKNYLLKTHRGTALHHVMDLGAGTGQLASSLMALAPQAHYIFVDFAREMLARYRERGNPTQISVVCADFESLPFPESTCDLIFSSMSLQWSMDLAATLKSWLGCMKKNGLLAIALPVAGTLAELDDCFSRMGYTGRVNSFWSVSDLMAMLTTLPVEIISAEQRVFHQVAQSARDLLHTIKKTGAHYKFNPEAPPKRVAWPGKHFLEHINDYYPKTAENTVMATFNIYFLILSSA